MSKILPFGQKPSRLSTPPSVRYYTLKDDALSVNGEHPLRGDLCSVQISEEVEGELHMVLTQAGQSLCGLLSREGCAIRLIFPNGGYPSYRGSDTEARVIGRVVDFFFKADDASRASVTLSAKALAARIDSVTLMGVHTTTAPVAPDSIVNWRADGQGHIIFASDDAGSHFPMADRSLTWDYIELVHPDHRETVRRSWMKALATRCHFNVLCEAMTSKGYQLVRNMAMPVRNRETGCDEWVGTLLLLGHEVATGTSEMRGR